MKYTLAVFNSRFATLNFANLLKSKHIPVAIINTPQGVTRACGISVKFLSDFVYYILVGALYFLVFMLGASVFSFLNVVAYRLPLKMSFVHGRSFCPHCKKTLSAFELVPVFSYVFLGGKCRACERQHQTGCQA